MKRVWTLINTIVSLRLAHFRSISSNVTRSGEGKLTILALGGVTHVLRPFLSEREKSY